MNSIELKYFKISVSIVVISTLNIMFFDSDLRLDVYVFMDHKRYICNIFRDISILYTVICLSKLLRKISDKIFYPLYVFSIASCICYFLFYAQMASLITIPIYLIALLYKLKWERHSI